MRVLGKFFITSLLISSLFGLFSNFTAADQIRLANGDVISGDFIDIFNGILKIKTEYAGVISVESNQVEEISSDIEYIFITVDRQQIQVKIKQLTNT